MPAAPALPVGLTANVAALGGGPARLRLGQAVALGALHGPAELMPISSSGHLTLLPWLLGWDYVDLDPDLRKAFEVALHAGTAAALLIALREEVAQVLHERDPRLLMLIVLSFAPPAAVGWKLEGLIERRLGRPGPIASGLAAGAVAMLWADGYPQLRGPGTAGVRDALWLGVAQACALVPGVSRGGATLAAARARRFTRVEASRLSRHVALPIIGGAAGLKAVRLRRRGLPPGTRVPFAAGALSAFGSTLAAGRLVTGWFEADRPVLPVVAYRLGLAALVGTRLRSGRCSTMLP